MNASFRVYLFRTRKAIIGNTGRVYPKIETKKTIGNRKNGADSQEQGDGMGDVPTATGIHASQHRGFRVSAFDSRRRGSISGKESAWIENSDRGSIETSSRRTSFSFIVGRCAGRAAAMITCHKNRCGGRGRRASPRQKIAIRCYRKCVGYVQSERGVPVPVR